MLKSSRRQIAFTLVEVLVVVVILMLLLTLLLPALKDAKRRAMAMQCVAQLRQIGVAAEMYMADNENYLVPGVVSPAPAGHPFKYINGDPAQGTYAIYHHMLAPYTGDVGEVLTDGADLTRCPELDSWWASVTTNSYGYNFQVRTGQEDGELVISPTYTRRYRRFVIAQPDGTMMACDAGHIDTSRYEGEPEDWAPQTNNPGTGLMVLPGNQGWAMYPGGASPSDTAHRPVPLARHLGGTVGTMFLDGHSELYPIGPFLLNQRGDPDCIYDAQ